ncbi:MAG TPA: translation initiation factor IF-3 [Candidatus Paceibacterota bacterium]|nr:translation initiation factor IF-3 [Candidatus Paceibacterota bacterium]
MSKDRTRINHQIKAPQVRVIGPEGENYGILTISEALQKAHDAGLDLIEISPNAVPPVAKITDYGKFSYEENKKQKAQKAKAHVIEIKTLQVKIGTGEHDLELKAKKASEWLAEGHRIKLDLFLPGRSKYLDPAFLEERLKRILALVTVPHRLAEKPTKSPKGLSTIIERA